jgi:asparagine synthase (glutamine-hydrolysing)
VTALAGIWRFDGRPGGDDDCARMLAAQESYGPHDKRQWNEGSLVIGRRLFRSLPEDIYDRQPLQTRDGRLTLVADLRLDNRDELVGELGLNSQQARQLCDAAILLEAFDRWGEPAVERLVGDFSFALWDANVHRLLLGRDFLGQRPLHYHRGKRFLAFASMPKGLHALAEISYAPDEQMIAEWLVWMPQRGPRSFFRDIARVEPGHVVTVTRDGISSRRYWQPNANDACLRSSDYVEGLRHHLDQATRSRLRGANGAVASHLSAGLDSSAVTATAARLLAPRGGKVVAFTAVPRAGYDNPRLGNRLADEGPLAAATAAMYPNIEHVLVRSECQSPLDGLDRACHLYECPVPNLFNLAWSSRINQAIHDRRLTILLTADLGNMTASEEGIDLLPELLSAGRFIRLWREARALLKTGFRGRRSLLLDTFGSFMPARLWFWANKKLLGACWNVLDYTPIRRSRFDELDLAKLARSRGHDFSHRPSANSFAMRLWSFYGEDNGHVFKGMLGGWGVDWRDPMADRRLVEYCLSVPNEEYLANGVPRSLAKRAFSDRLPQAVLDERRRGYQAADWHEALTAARAEVAAELDRLAECAPARRAIDFEKMKRLIQNLPSSGWERLEVIQDYRIGLVNGISAGHFLRKTSGAN